MAGLSGHFCSSSRDYFLLFILNRYELRSSQNISAEPACISNRTAISSGNFFEAETAATGMLQITCFDKQQAFLTR